MNQAAYTELHTILDAIATERGVLAAAGAALALRCAVEEGRIDGRLYRLEDGCGCAVGHLCDALGLDADDVKWCRAVLPGWTPGDGLHAYTPIEQAVISLRFGDTPATTPRLRALVACIDAWLTLHDMMPRDLDAFYLRLSRPRLAERSESDGP